VRSTPDPDWRQLASFTDDVETVAARLWDACREQVVAQVAALADEHGASPAQRALLHATVERRARCALREQAVRASREMKSQALMLGAQDG
jgi:hypothetical protein